MGATRIRPLGITRLQDQPVLLTRRMQLVLGCGLFLIFDDYSHPLSQFVSAEVPLGTPLKQCSAEIILGTPLKQCSAEIPLGDKNSQ